MSNQQIFSPETLADLYHLTISDIQRIVAAEGRLCFSLEEEAFLVYVPLFTKCVRFSSHYKALRNKLTPKDFNIRADDTILVVTSDSQYPSAFLMLEDFTDLLEEHMDVTEETAVLLAKSAKLPLFFGHVDVINRLADDFEKIDGTVMVNNFLDWRAQHV